MLTAEQVAADHPQAAAALIAQGASAERARIQAIEAQTIPGHEALISALKFDGQSSAGDAAMAIVAAEKSSRAAFAAATAADAPAPLALTPAPSIAPQKDDAPKTRHQLDAATKAYMAAHPGTDYVAAFKLVQEA